MKYLSLLFYVLLVLPLTGRAAEPEKPLPADSLLALSRQCYTDDRLIEALDYATQTLRQAKKEQNKPTYMCGLANIAGIYGVFRDYDKAHHYFGQCLEYAKALNDTDMIARCYSNLTMTSCMLGRADEARRHLAMQQRWQMRDTVRQHFFLLSNKGKVAAAENDWQQALLYARQARDYASQQQMGLVYVESETGQMADAYEHLGDDSTAIRLYHDMVSMVQQTGDQKGASRAYAHLAAIYRRLGDSRMAARYQDQALAVDDSVFNLRAFNSAKGRLAGFEEEQNAERISLLGKRITQQLLVISLIVVLLAVVVVLAVVLVRRNRSLQSAYQLLVEKNKEAISRSEAAALPPAEEHARSTVGDHLPTEQQQQLLRAIADVLRDEQVVCSPDFDLARLSTLVGSNTKYVSWVINDHYGQSFKSLLNTCRIRLASKRLSDEENYGHLTIQAVAESVGYKSQTNFIQAFKSVVGMTPSMYQKMVRPKS